ncbi:ppGpp synthetase/RelA/SpoT-type nucleotidyltransferase [Clostridium acetobutylicum]|nr:ppGpp synthetase/RelA/SpoT-type nucleotidyltransferase [Clostridium acetobutylicum]
MAQLEDADDIVEYDIEERIEEMQEMIMKYSAAIKEVKTKLEILDNEFKVKRKEIL